MTREEALRLAEASGVDRKTFEWRVRNGWTLEEATMLKNPKTKRKRERLRRRLNGENLGDN